jgi:hypothetical protein
VTERARVEISVETRVWDRDVRLLNMRNRERANKGETHQELEEVVTADEGEVWMTARDRWWSAWRKKDVWCREMPRTLERAIWPCALADTRAAKRRGDTRFADRAGARTTRGSSSRGGTEGCATTSAKARLVGPRAQCLFMVRDDFSRPRKRQTHTHAKNNEKRVPGGEIFAEEGEAKCIPPSK